MKYIGKTSKVAESVYNKCVSDYYKKLSLSENFKLDTTTEDYLINILKNVEVTKAPGIDQITGKF